jgi:hypothetical protein
LGGPVTLPHHSRTADRNSKNRPRNFFFFQAREKKQSAGNSKQRAATPKQPAWVQHFIRLAPHGMAGFVLANGSMSSSQCFKAS